MDNRALAQFHLEDGTEFLVEVPRPRDDSAIGLAADVDVTGTVYEAEKNFEAMLEKVQPVASTVLEKFKSGLTTPAQEVELKFGLTLSVEAGVIFSSVGGDVNFEVTLKWRQKD
ncbi:MAG: CU044_2847 family protein [Elainellaceae cyanobacterium]